METYRLRLSITRTYETEVEVEATSLAEARARASDLNVDGLLLRKTATDQVEVLAGFGTSKQKVA